MANNYFKFKQFTVYQDQCAMKVCTDACIFGAYVAARLNTAPFITSNLLDIGTGTGLLSLMMAQKATAEIDAVEIDEPAFQQAKENFAASPWRKKLNIYNTDILKYDADKRYNCIMSNPPFFEGDLKSADSNINAARHDITLSLQQLMAAINKHLSPSGFFTLLLPVERMDFFTSMASNEGYFLNEQLLVQHTKTHPFFRCVLFFSHTHTNVIHNELVINDESGKYTPALEALLRDYYFYL